MIESRLNFHKHFYWFDKKFVEPLNKACFNFLHLNVDFHLMALTNKPSMIWKGNDYFVTQIEVDNYCSVYMRISDEAAQVLLEKTFGKRPNLKLNSGLKNITELEAQILTNFNQYLFKNLDNVLIDTKKFSIAKNQKKMMFDEDLIHLTFFIHNESIDSEDYGKIIISFPEYILKNLALLPEEENNFQLERFLHNTCNTNIIVGSSKNTLTEIQSLETEDILILDKSTIYYMYLVTENEKIRFKVYPDQRLVLDIDNSNEGDLTMGANSSLKKIWDNLQLEVTAEFQKIKMTLGDLKQITEGLVVDVANISNNEISLHVEGRPIANGELIIVGDKYGVRITKVFQEEDEHQELDVIPKEQLMQSSPRALDGSKKPQIEEHPVVNYNNQQPKQKRQESYEPEESNYAPTDIEDEDDDNNDDEDDGFDYNDFEIEDDDND